MHASWCVCGVCIKLILYACRIRTTNWTLFLSIHLFFFPWFSAMAFNKSLFIYFVTKNTKFLSFYQRMRINVCVCVCEQKNVRYYVRFARKMVFDFAICGRQLQQQQKIRWYHWVHLDGTHDPRCQIPPILIRRWRTFKWWRCKTKEVKFIYRNKWKKKKRYTHRMCEWCSEKNFQVENSWELFMLMLFFSSLQFNRVISFVSGFLSLSHLN